MNRLRFPVLATVGLTVLLMTSAARSAPIRGDKSGLEQVPISSPIVLHLRGVQGTRDRFVTMMENALPEVLKKFQPQMDEFLKNGFMGRKLRGAVKDGPAFLAFTELPKANDPAAGPPKMAVIVAVSNYKEFRDNILNEEERKAIKVNGEGVESVAINNEPAPTYFVDRKGYAVVTPNEDVANLFTKKQKGLDDKLSKEQAARFLGSDFGVYVNMELLNKQYAEEFKKAREGIGQAIDLFAPGGDDSQKKAIELFKKAIGPIFQAIEDTRSVLLTVDFRPGGLALHIDGEVVEGSTTAALLQDSKPAALKELDRLPQGQAYYLGMKTSSALYKGLGGLMFGVVQDPDSKEAKAVGAALDELAKAGPGVRVDGYSFPIKGLQVYQYDEPAKAVDAMVKLFGAMGPGGGFSSGVLKEKPVLKTKAQKHGDFELHSVQFVWDFDKMAEQVAARGGDDAKKQFVEVMKGVMGDKLTVWFGTDGKSVVQVSAADWASARKLLDDYAKGGKTAGDAKAFQDARKEMPKQASLLGLFDSVQLAGTITDVMKPFMGNAPLPPNWPNKPEKGTSAFVGLSVTLQPQRGSLDTFITAAAAQEFYKAYIKPFLGQ
ncbi:MAG TPA: hypothetical protein VH643_17615 [Gemmataceae bacterium]|jgi:hypothetical protein